MNVGLSERDEGGVKREKKEGKVMHAVLLRE